jgi:23S rRNA pseudouridine1911/1915/1917 synthase
MQDETMIAYTVPQEQEGWRLRAVLLTGIGLSRKLLTRLKTSSSAITVNGEPRWLHEPMFVGDTVHIRLPLEQSSDILPQPMDLDIVHEDEHLLIVNKPWGLIVHPTHGHYINTLANGVVYYWQQQGVRHRFRPVHRLDQDTSGVLAIAKNAYAHQFISEQFQLGRVQKTYIAIVYGRLHNDQGTIDAPIDRSPENPHVRMVLSGGAASVTNYEVIERIGEATIVRLRPVTGRTHQIRVHMQYIGHPLIGDSLYVRKHDNPFSATMGRQALHAQTLCFTHPGSKQIVCYEAQLPQDMQQLIVDLRSEVK